MHDHQSSWISRRNENELYRYSYISSVQNNLFVNSNIHLTIPIEEEEEEEEENKQTNK
jgi:hypothetical protein